jgi:hypothetical protein
MRYDPISSHTEKDNFIPKEWMISASFSSFGRGKLTMIVQGKRTLCKTLPETAGGKKIAFR